MEVDPGPTPARRLERLKRAGTEVGAGEAFSTTGTGRKKGYWDFVPFIATGRKNMDWERIYSAAEAVDGGYQNQEQREVLEDLLDWTERQRGVGSTFGAVLGEAPVFVGEYAAAGWLLKGLGKAVTATNRGKKLGEVLERMRKSKLMGRLEENAAAATLGKLAAGGAKGLAVGAAAELPRGEWGQVAANARSLMFQRNFNLSEDEAGELIVEVADQQSTIMDVLPQAVLDTAIEFTSEGLGAGIPLVGKLDALTDTVVSKLFTKVGVKRGREILRKGGLGGAWEEVAEEFAGGAAREVAAELDPEQFGEMAGSLPDSLGEVLEMYAAFSFMGASGAAVGALGGVDEGSDQSPSPELSDTAAQSTPPSSPDPVELQAKLDADTAEVQEAIDTVRKQQEELPSRAELKLDQMEAQGQEEELPPVTELRLDRMESVEAGEEAATHPSDATALEEAVPVIEEPRLHANRYYRLARPGVADFHRRTRV